MRTARDDHEPVLITDAERSFDDEQRARKKVYAILMVFHIVGFTAAGLVAVEHLWWLAIVLLVLTGPLPWIAVIFANERRGSATAYHGTSGPPDSPAGGQIPSPRPSREIAGGRQAD